MQLMLLKFIKIIFLFLLASYALQAQEKDPVEIDFLFNYYQQDGNKSAVTGGKGTEELSVSAPVFVVHVPLAADRSLDINAGIDVYSSASSDRIDYRMSSASSRDIRSHIDLHYSLSTGEGNNIYGFSLGGSNEFDYNSASLGANWARTSHDGNREFSISGRVYYDLINKIYPVELRGVRKWLQDDTRQTFNLSLSLAQVLGKKVQALLTSDLVYQQGLLSTPFHRVYFQGLTEPRVEYLPDNRLKWPIGLRFNYFISDQLVMRSMYRYYLDNFGLEAHTISIELPVRFSQSFALTPFYRFYQQTAADYYAAYARHRPDKKFYTSDPDLGPFDSHKYGIGFRYYPLQGISDFASPLAINFTRIKRFDLRLALYDRTDGLSALSVSTGVSFAIH